MQSYNFEPNQSHLRFFLTLTNEQAWGRFLARTHPQLVVFLGALGNKKNYAS